MQLRLINRTDNKTRIEIAITRNRKMNRDLSKTRHSGHSAAVIGAFSLVSAIALFVAGQAAAAVRT